MQRIACRVVAQPRPPVFGGENQMDVNGGKGLWHDKMMTNCGMVRQTQRDCDLQPKVGAPAPTLGYRSNHHQPQRGCGECGATIKRNGRNRVAVENVGATLTQGSSCLATPGFGTESRWDSELRKSVLHVQAASRRNAEAIRGKCPITPIKSIPQARRNRKNIDRPRPPNPSHGIAIDIRATDL